MNNEKLRLTDYGILFLIWLAFMAGASYLKERVYKHERKRLYEKAHPEQAKQAPCSSRSVKRTLNPSRVTKTIQSKPVKVVNSND